MKIGHVIPERGTIAIIVGPQGKGTQGKLEHDSTIFGRVIYHGTTLGGYSGAAYMVANQITGIHLNGGKRNGGFSASYIWVTLCFLEKVKQESTEDWLNNTFATKKRFLVDTTWGDLDTQRIKINGQFAVVERSSLAKTLGADWKKRMNEDGLVYLQKENQYEDVIEESGEATSSNAPGGSSELINTQELAKENYALLTHVCKTLSPEHQKGLIRHLQTIRESSNTQESGRRMRRQLNGVSNSSHL